MMWRRAALASLLPAALLVLSCSRPAPDPCAAAMRRHEALPVLAPIDPRKPIELLALYLEDSRVPALSGPGRAELYGRAAGLVRRWYGYDVRFREIGARPLLAEFAGRQDIFGDLDGAACRAAALSWLQVPPVSMNLPRGELSPPSKACAACAAPPVWMNLPQGELSRSWLRVKAPPPAQ